ncbi:MAG TPA: small basic protein [Planctomycetota bacterium]|nr:small basic protein [Planctomycetota bacterium]
MSIHKSLVSDARLRRQRNVLTRWERIVQMREEGRWEEARSVFCLPKVKVAHHKRHKKAKKEVKEEGEGVAAEGAAAPAETPAPEAPRKEAKRKESPRK